MVMIVDDDDDDQDGDEDAGGNRCIYNVQGVFFNWCPPKSSKCQIT